MKKDEKSKESRNTVRVPEGVRGWFHLYLLAWLLNLLFSFPSLKYYIKREWYKCKGKGIGIGVGVENGGNVMRIKENGISVKVKVLV